MFSAKIMLLGLALLSFLLFQHADVSFAHDQMQSLHSQVDRFLVSLNGTTGP